MCLDLDGVGRERGERMRVLGLGFTNPVATVGVMDVCRCLGCGGLGRVGGEWVVGSGFEPGSGEVGWCYVSVSCESRLYV